MRNAVAPAEAAEASGAPEPDLDHSWIDGAPSHANSIEFSAPRPCASTDEVIFSVEQVTQPSAVSTSGSWLGWASAAVLLIIGGTFYGLRYAPLQSALERADRDNAKLAADHSAEMKRLSSDLEDRNLELELLQLSREVGTAHPDESVPKPKALEPTKATTEATRERVDASPNAHRAVDTGSRSAGKAAHRAKRVKRWKRVDRAAAAAATARLQTQPMRGGRTATPPSRAGSTPPHSGRDALSGVLEETNDPLHGL